MKTTKHLSLTRITARLLAACCMFVCLQHAVAQTKTDTKVKWGQWEKWGNMNDGTYRNPVIVSDYSDLDCIRVGDDFYAITSTFQYSPGMTLIHSKDLVNWEICTNVVDDITQIGEELSWTRMNRYGRGIWAGTIRYHAGRFYVFFGAPDEGFFMTSADKPEGPWEPLTTLFREPGWDDCSAFWDKDGKAYFIATHFTDNYKSYLFTMSPDGKSIDRESAMLVNEGNRREASKLIKVGEWYYIVFSEFNSSLGRYVMAKRAKSITGPYLEEKQLALPNRDAKEPNQGGIIDNGQGEWFFFTHHGSGGDWGGRMASLLRVTWVDGWPIIGEITENGMGKMEWAGTIPVKGQPKYEIARSDEFSGTTINPQWQWNYQPRQDKYSLKDREGWLRMRAYKPLKENTLEKAGNTLTQRCFRTKHNSVVVKMDLSGMANGQRCGLSHFTVKNSAIGITMKDGEKYLEYRENDVCTEGSKLTANHIWLKTEWGLDGLAHYFYSVDGVNFSPFGSAWQMVWFKYRGDRIAIYNFNDKEESGYVDVDYLRYDME